MLHEPAAQSGPDPASSYKQNLGAWMFFIYGLVYAGFIVINIANPLLMERPILWDMNLAVFYGFGLILLALLQAIFYNHLCTRMERKLKLVGQEGNDND